MFLPVQMWTGRILFFSSTPFQRRPIPLQQKENRMATKVSSSVIDQPVTLSNQDKLSEKDKFGISKYERALTRFIEQADTPLTIALQGEWGSGKTSLMNLLKYHLCEADNASYYSVWINTWQHSIMSDPEDAIVGILQSIIYQLGNASSKTADEKKKRISPIIDRAVKIAGIGAANIAGKWLLGVSNAGSEVKAAMDSLKEPRDVPETGESKIADFRNSIADLINEILKEEKDKKYGRKGFLFFIDDLDRIDPPVAVQILELLKNIFDLEHCIYVLAIDYDVVVKGLKPKFGELTDKNAREFRSFFDKIIQLPFAMPVGSYQIDNFLIDMLGRIGYLTDDEKKNEELKKNLSEMARYSVGTNPRSLKRLTNILSLIQLMTEEIDSSNIGDRQSPEEILVDKQVNFALVCLQITYPLVYNTMLDYPNFRHWGDTNEDSDGVGNTLIKKLSLQELDEAQQKKLEKQGEDFDEPWERVLFQICLKDTYLSSRVVDISKLLNKISSLIRKGEDKETLEKDHDEAVAQTIEQLIRFSAVTNVHASEETVGNKKIEDFNPSGWLCQFRDIFVPKLNSLLKGFDTIKCTNKRVRGQLNMLFEKPQESPNGEARITMGHDDSLYHVIWTRRVRFLHGGFGSILEEEQLLGCSGLHDSVVAELKEYAEKYPGITLKIDVDTYKEATREGQKCGWLVLEVDSSSETLEGLVTDETVDKFAVYINDLYRIRFKMSEKNYTYSFCQEWDNKIREQLKQMSIAPFTEMKTYSCQVDIQGCIIKGNSFGISLHLRSNGYQTTIWAKKQILDEVMNSHSELQKFFSQHNDNQAYWYAAEIVPFDFIIDWLKDLQRTLVSLQ